jgi:hypothetical protein
MRNERCCLPAFNVLCPRKIPPKEPSASIHMVDKHEVQGTPKTTANVYLLTWRHPPSENLKSHNILDEIYDMMYFIKCSWVAIRWQ